MKISFLFFLFIVLLIFGVGIMLLYYFPIWKIENQILSQPDKIWTNINALRIIIGMLSVGCIILTLIIFEIINDQDWENMKFNHEIETLKQKQAQFEQQYIAISQNTKTNETQPTNQKQTAKLRKTKRRKRVKNRSVHP